MPHNHIKKSLFALCFLIVACQTSSTKTASQDENSINNIEANQKVSGSPLSRSNQTSTTSDIVYNADENKPDLSTQHPSIKKPSYIIGGGSLLNAQNAERAKSVSKVGDSKVSLNFSEVPISDAVAAIIGENLGRKYFIDPNVTGSITLQTGGPVPVKDLWYVLEATLSQQNISLVDEGDLVHILPSPLAKQFARIRTDLNGNGYTVYAAPLKYVSANEMARILQPIAPEGSILRVDVSRNLLILAGTPSELSSLSDTISTFDVDWLSGMTFGVYPLQSTNPENIVRDLEALFNDGSSTPIEGLVRFLPSSSQNAVIAITPTPNILPHVQTWIDKFDVGAEIDNEQLYVYDVQNGTAAELALVLQNVLGSGDGRSGGGGSAPLNTRRVNDALQEQIQGESSQFDPRDDNRGSFSNNTTSSRGSLLTLTNDNVSIYPYDSKNALVIVATPSDYERIRGILQKLDVVSNQVLLEATIAEVTLVDELELGLQWFFQDENNQATLSSNNQGAIGSVFPGFSYVFSRENVQVALNALSSITDVKVISSPSLMVLDNQTASLQVGDEVPVVTQQSVTNSLNTPIFNSVEFRNTGVILNITPRVNENGLVLLDIEQEVSSVVPTVTSGIDSPTIQQRRIQTSVAVNDGESLALGGLIEEGETRTSSGVPFASDIPILGNLFKTETETDSRTELLIIITPRVVRNSDEARSVTDEYRRRLNTLRRFDLGGNDKP